jgi:hypothetical protein
VRATAALEVTQLNRLTHDKTKHAITHFGRLNVIEPVPTNICVMLPQIINERSLEVWFEIRHKCFYHARDQSISHLIVGRGR